jgi:hypothetical protein
MGRIRLKPGQTIGLKLTPVERELLVESILFPDPRLEEKLQAAGPGAQEVHLTLPELNGLTNCLAAQLKRTERDRKLGARLNRIWQRIKQIEAAFEADDDKKNE